MTVRGSVRLIGAAVAGSVTYVVVPERQKHASHPLHGDVVKTEDDSV